MTLGRVKKVICDCVAASVGIALTYGLYCLIYSEWTVVKVEIIKP